MCINMNKCTGVILTPEKLSRMSYAHIKCSDESFREIACIMFFRENSKFFGGKLTRDARIVNFEGQPDTDNSG